MPTTHRGQVSGFQPLANPVPGHVPLQARYLVRVLSRLAAVSLPPCLRHPPASRLRRDWRSEGGPSSARADQVAAAGPRAVRGQDGDRRAGASSPRPARHASAWTGDDVSPRLEGRAGAAGCDLPAACDACAARDSEREGALQWCLDDWRAGAGEAVAEQASQRLSRLIAQEGEVAAAYLAASVCVPALAEMGQCTGWDASWRDEPGDSACRAHGAAQAYGVAGRSAADMRSTPSAADAPETRAGSDDSTRAVGERGARGKGADDGAGPGGVAGAESRAGPGGVAGAGDPAETSLGHQADTAGDGAGGCHGCGAARVAWMVELLLAPLQAAAAARAWLQLVRACRWQCRQAGSGLGGLELRRRWMRVLDALLEAAARRRWWTADAAPAHAAGDGLADR